MTIVSKLSSLFESAEASHAAQVHLQLGRRCCIGDCIACSSLHEKRCSMVAATIVEQGTILQPRRASGASFPPHGSTELLRPTHLAAEVLRLCSCVCVCCKAGRVAIYVITIDVRLSMHRSSVNSSVRLAPTNEHSTQQELAVGCRNHQTSAPRPSTLLLPNRGP